MTDRPRTYDVLNHLMKFHAFPEETMGKYCLIEALAPGFESLIAPGGRALLSGLLVDQAPRLTEVLAALGWQVTESASQGRWGLLCIRRRSPETP